MQEGAGVQLVFGHSEAENVRQLSRLLTLTHVSLTHAPAPVTLIDLSGAVQDATRSDDTVESPSGPGKALDSIKASNSCDIPLSF